MGNYALATRYAHALLDELPDEHADRGCEQVRDAAELWRRSRDLRRVMLNPFIPVEERAEMMGRIADRAKWPKLVRDFLGLLVQNERIALLPELTAALADLVRLRRRQDVAHVESPVPLTDEETARLARRLGERLGVTLVPRVEVKPELLGGLRVRVGDTVFDATVTGNLESLREALIKGT